MNLKIKLFGLFICSALLFLSSCTFPYPVQEGDLLGSEFTSFSLRMSENPTILYQVDAYQDGQDIYLNYPDLGSSPNLNFVPYFETEAATVEVNGVVQVNGVSSHDFSNPVPYTLTSFAGKVEVYDVHLTSRSGWRTLLDIGPILNFEQMKAGVMPNMSPYVISLENGNIRPYEYYHTDGSWGGYASFGNCDEFDTANWNNLTWLFTNSNTNLIEIRSMIPPTIYGGTIFSIGTGTGALDMHGSGSDMGLLVSWIDDALNNRVPTLYSYNGITTLALGVGSFTGLTANSFASVIGGQNDYHAAGLFQEAPGVLHYFRYDPASDSWIMKKDDQPPTVEEQSQIIFDMFFDPGIGPSGAPVLAVLVPSTIDPGFQDLKFLYWSESASTWTDLNYIASISVNNADVGNLSISFDDSDILISVQNAVYRWEEGYWKRIGGDVDPLVPVCQSVSPVFIEGVQTYMNAIHISGNAVSVRLYK